MLANVGKKTHEFVVLSPNLELLMMMEDHSAEFCSFSMKMSPNSNVIVEDQTVDHG